jgi:hypothetical protein
MQLTATRSSCLRAQTAVLCARRPTQPLRAYHRLSVRCDSDDEIVPILSGRQKKGFTPKEYEKLRNPELLGGATIGDELSLIRKQYLTAEQQAAKKFEVKKSANWDGDVYIGSGWNELSAGILIIIVIPLLGLLFAWATYGTLWATGEFY